MGNRREVILFADAMEHKLRLKDYKGGWHDLPLEKLFELLKGEAQELEEAVKEGNTFDIMAEAADVGNYAMMIMDNAIRRITNGESDQDPDHQTDVFDPTPVARATNEFIDALGALDALDRECPTKMVIGADGVAHVVPGSLLRNFCDDDPLRTNRLVNIEDCGGGRICQGCGVRFGEPHKDKCVRL